MSQQQAKVICVCNPLLDISAEVPLSFFEKYNVKPGHASLAEPSQAPMYKELAESFPVEYIAGGAGQNSARACQWMSQVPGTSHYIGCVGKDTYADELKKHAQNDGVTVHYLEDATTKTGTCAVLVHDKERALVADLGAANNYKHEHYLSNEIQELVKSTNYFYVTGFFLTVSPKTMLALAQHAAENNKVFILNLSAVFLIQFFWDRMSAILPYVDVIISNEDEAAAFGEKNGWGNNLEEVASKLAGWFKVNDKRPRTVIFTQGARQTLVCADGVVKAYPTLRVPKEEIVDTNGAGDSFVGGFLSRYIQGKSVEESVAAGHYCASVIIRVSGTKFSGVPNFTYTPESAL